MQDAVQLHITYCLLTESEVIKGKSQTRGLDLMY